jgi:hypothetical protein
MRGLKAGDLFEVSIDGTKQFIQYLSTDKSCLNGHVVRVFDHAVNLNEPYQLEELVKKPIKFYTHTILQAGVKLGVWKKVGNVPLGSNFNLPFFRHTEDARDPKIKKSNKWYIWQVNGSTIDIGQLTDDHAHLSVGGLTHPLDIVKRLKTGEDVLEYPL